MRERPSPNFDLRPAGQAIDMLVLHYTGMPSAAAALDRLCDPVAKVSAHYLIDEAGEPTALVAETARAWHAGVAYWAGATDINGCSIGIELANPGHEWGYVAFAAAQYATLIALARAILARHPIPAHRVLAHSDVAPERRQDPGEQFDWERLAAAGIGWVAERTADPRDLKADRRPSHAAIAALQQDLARFGYRIEPTGTFDKRTTDVVAAFQRHYRRQRVDGVPDPETLAVLAELLARRPA
ncbi:MAG: N-acetylmuramoyl-L-alanine amidase [Alphaproteobacteria bacterium]|nr:N-acetylmuramoyl-L-alanine amidase [Alphaproteobacteria bacterium]